MCYALQGHCRQLTLLLHCMIATDSSAQESDTGLGAILPTWTAVDASNVKTSRELWESMKLNGWNVDYYRYAVFQLRLTLFLITLVTS